MRSSLSFVLIGLLCPAVTGCGSDDTIVDMAPVQGTVTCNGQPLTQGMIVFNAPPPSKLAPGQVMGKAASAAIGSDGTFVLTTFVPDDGAAIGNHIVEIRPASTEGPDPEEDEEIEIEDERLLERIEAAREAAAFRPLPCASPANLLVEVKPGKNVFKIDMSAGTATREE